MKGAALSRWGGNGDTVQEEESGASGQHQVKITIVHPDRLFRESLALALAGSPQAMTVVACVGEIGELARLGSTRPHVVLLGGRRPVDLHRQAVRLKSWFPLARVLLMHKSAGTIKSSHAQAQGQIGLVHPHHNNSSFQGLLQHVYQLGRERPSQPFDLGIVEPHPDESAASREHRKEQDWLGLTPREQEILRLRQTGLSNKDVAITLDIGVQTVKNHVHNISVKIGLSRVNSRSVAT
ncbi:MAG: response regulator transcription factor [Nitrospira sp.]|nr:response regulator transcription factor [Nitrospira sp.]